MLEVEDADETRRIVRGSGQHLRPRKSAAASAETTSAGICRALLGDRGLAARRRAEEGEDRLSHEDVPNELKSRRRRDRPPEGTSSTLP